MRSIFYAIALLTLGLTFGACSGGPPVSFYTLAPTPPASIGPAAQRIGVLPFDVDAPYDGSRLVYRTSPDSPRVDFYAYHQWAAPVGEEIASLVATELSGRLPGHLVEVAFASRDYVAFVHGRVLRLEEVDRAGAIETHAILEIELRSPQGSVWTVERVEGREEAATASVDEVVRMMQGAVSSAVQVALPTLVQGLEKRASGAGEDG